MAAWTLEIMASHPRITTLVLVHHPEDDPMTYLGAHFQGTDLITVHGGATRAGSVAAGLSAVPDDYAHVLIHDVARPCVSHAVIDRVLDALATTPGAAPGLAVTDALWTGERGLVTGTHPREGLFRAQTPQGFDLAAIRAAHADTQSVQGVTAADDVEIARHAGLDVAIVAGDEANLKITGPQDFARAAAQLEKAQHMMDIRTGHGYDVHKFGPGDHVTLCGIDIAHDRGLVGHSDADVGLHTITDAIYGALARGDIGQHFPPSDPQWKGAASHIFLEHARDLAREMGFTLTHVDCTLICEEPKIGPHAAAMRARLAEILQLDMDRISVKATTSEGLGFTGRREGITCMATATVIRP